MFKRKKLRLLVQLNVGRTQQGKLKGIQSITKKITNLSPICNINHNDEITTNNTKEHSRIAKKNWEEMKLKEKEFREQELLELWLNKLIEELLSNEHHKKAAI